MSVTKYLKTLADEMRLRIIRILSRGSFNVNEIIFILNGKQSNISHHLKILLDSDLAVSKKEGSETYYRLKDFSQNRVLHSLIKTILSEEKEIDRYGEDLKRLEAIYQKRKTIAEVFFNTIGEEKIDSQEKLFKDIYRVDEVIPLFGRKLGVVVDIGCGTGRDLPLLANYAEKVIGIDSSPKMLQLSEHICRKNNLHYELQIADILHLPLEKESVDGVLLNMVLHHVADPAVALKEISSILKEDGLLLLIDLVSHSDEEMRDKFADLWLGFHEEEIHSWLSENKFRIETQRIKTGNDTGKKVLVVLAKKIG